MRARAQAPKCQGTPEPHSRQTAVFCLPSARVLHHQTGPPLAPCVCCLGPWAGEPLLVLRAKAAGAPASGLLERTTLRPSPGARARFLPFLPPRAPPSPCISAPAASPRPMAAPPAPPSAAWLGRSVQHHLPRISRPPLRTPRPSSLVQGTPGAGGELPGSALSPASRRAAGPDASWRWLRSSGMVCSGPPAETAAAAMHFCGARCSFVP